MVLPTAGAGGWYYGIGGKQMGPIPLHELQQLVRSGQLGPSVLVWADGMPNWVPAGSLPVLFPGGGALESPGIGLLVPVGPQSGVSIAAGYLGLFSLVLGPLCSVPAVLCGILGIRDLRRYPEKRGWGRALTGLIAGGLVSLGWLIFFVALALG